MSRAAWVLLFVLLALACRDSGAEAWERARLAHRALLDAAARPEDPRFEAVLSDLASVPLSSRHAAEAEQLRQSILAARVKVRTPLALVGGGRRPPDLEAQLAACGRLAALAGADGGVDRRALEALEACRKQAERLELRYAHADELEDGGSP